MLYHLPIFLLRLPLTTTRNERLCVQERISQACLKMRKQRRIIHLRFPFCSIIEWWRYNSPEIKGSNVSCWSHNSEASMWKKWILFMKNVFRPFFRSLPFQHKLRWIKQSHTFHSEMIKLRRRWRDIVVLSQSAKHSSLSGSQAEYFIAEWSCFMVENFHVCHLHHRVSTWFNSSLTLCPGLRWQENVFFFLFCHCFQSSTSDWVKIFQSGQRSCPNCDLIWFGFDRSWLCKTSRNVAQRILVYLLLITCSQHDRNTNKFFIVQSNSK